MNPLLLIFRQTVIVIYYPGGRVNVPFPERRRMENIEYPDNVVFREEPEGGILFNVDTGEMKLVENVAWGICDLIEKGKTRSQILKILTELYPDETDLEIDLDSFLEELVETRFLITSE